MSAKNENIDRAKELAEEFKRQGFLDKLKHDILSQNWNKDESTDNTIEAVNLQEAIRNKVMATVNEMVKNDENLIFKNRGTTSALIEAQLFKDKYKKLAEGDDGVPLDKYIQMTLSDPKLEEGIKRNLATIAADEDDL
ncbi:hypothetical protein NCAS_0B07300 [Naumovozyma castellii]|uniref:BOD1/SHG1 domain-containing protein n=1 Tax=Naumovozyma castellii TaxID=27288 RepID=G0VA84_NAUCA|nr:hypothetical protein NCAS_0B07300 [Naumovozyma castellii CBS 4309]CCC68814.1 hypothetical protein NCAS_0B07300 [Naumovozyma castellii CBS 4309]